MRLGSLLQGAPGHLVPGQSGLLLTGAAEENTGGVRAALFDDLGFHYYTDTQLTIGY